VLAVYQVTPWAGTEGFYVRTKTNTTQRYALRTSKGDVANYVQVAANVADGTLALTLENDAPATPPSGGDGGGSTPGADPNGGSGVKPQPQPSGVSSWSKSKQVGVFCGIAAAAVVVATVIAVSVVLTRKKSRARGVSRTKP
jgi:hypothetical protein